MEESYQGLGTDKTAVRVYRSDGRKSRKGDIGVECSKGLLPAIFTSGGVAAKLRFRVCAGGHAGALGEGLGGVMVKWTGGGP